MKVEINADWPKTIEALIAYRFAEEEFRAEFIDGEPTSDAFFMAIRMQCALEKVTKALGNEYLAKHPGPIGRLMSKLKFWNR